jgi:hypothetical protein
MWFRACIVLAVAACSSEQRLRDDCTTPGVTCPACASDSDCEIVSNACHEAATCTDRRRELQVNQIGCLVENDVPADDRCACIQGMCRSR